MGELDAWALFIIIHQQQQKSQQRQRTSNFGEDRQRRRQTHFGPSLIWPNSFFSFLFAFVHHSLFPSTLCAFTCIFPLKSTKISWSFFPSSLIPTNPTKFFAPKKRRRMASSNSPLPQKFLILLLFFAVNFLSTTLAQYNYGGMNTGLGGYGGVSSYGQIPTTGYGGYGQYGTGGYGQQQLGMYPSSSLGMTGYSGGYPSSMMTGYSPYGSSFGGIGGTGSSLYGGSPYSSTMLGGGTSLLGGGGVGGLSSLGGYGTMGSGGLGQMTPQIAQYYQSLMSGMGRK